MIFSPTSTNEGPTNEEQDRDYSHNIEDCLQLKDGIEALIRRYYLGKYV